MSAIKRTTNKRCKSKLDLSQETTDQPKETMDQFYIDKTTQIPQTLDTNPPNTKLHTDLSPYSPSFTIWDPIFSPSSDFSDTLVAFYTLCFSPSHSNVHASTPILLKILFALTPWVNFQIDIVPL